ncbi:MFS transporter [Micromonospora sp. DR5-3]|uniref:MFS transporter n=1 Tax=unclassified Micromonospora TaxID=2617518 RepID=UPI0011DA789F|nr:MULTISPECIES: MFS transporter [unclassified Micromonospora]MCW3820411.1 MFS transporter [Micromonospora sp. DR5-3]TYC19422.1 MFS transporter [Micromonospora sp. MP36]
MSTPASATAPSAAPAPDAARSGARALFAVCAATLLVLMNYTAPVAVLPQTARSLGAGLTTQTWLINAITLGLAATLLVAGSLGDDFGRRRIFRAGLALLAASTLGAAVAPDAGTFIAARVAQGIASAAILAVGLGLLAHTYPTHQGRAHATALWASMIGAGIAVGPLASAALTALSSWRWLYLLLATLAAVLAAAGGRLLAESRAERAARIDVPGVLTLGAGLALLLIAVTAGRTGWLRPTVLIPLVLAVLLLAAFVATEARTRAPMLDLALFRRPDFQVATLGALFTGLAALGPSTVLPTLVQRLIGVNALGTAGLAFLWAGASYVVSNQMRHHGTRVAPTRQLALGFALTAAGYLAMLGYADAHSWVRTIPGLLISGAGSGLLNAALARLAVASVPPDRVAMGSGANNTARYVGASLGVAASITVASSLLPAGQTGGFSAHGADAVLLLGTGVAVLGAAAALIRRRVTAPAPA